VISNDEFNINTCMVIVCPITSTDNRFPLHIKIATDNDVSGYLCLEQMRAVDLAAREATKLGRIDDQIMEKILETVHLFF
jgi:mRNA interferase MazF